jgi:tetratricopeptide (TPR) repeat protein
MRLRLTVTGMLLSLVGGAIPVRAQPAEFVQAVRALASASTQSESARAEGVRAATAQMQSALREWDRRLEAMQERVERSAPASAAERARALHIELGLALRTRGRFDGALRQFEAALAIQPSSDLHLLRALTLDAAGRTHDSIASYATAAALDPESALKAYYALVAAPPDGAERARAGAILSRAYDRLTTAAPSPPPPFPVLDAVPDSLSRAPIVANAALGPVFAALATARYSDAVAALRHVDPAGLDIDDGPRARFSRAQRDEAANSVAAARQGYQAALDATLAGRSTLLVGMARLAQVEGDAAAAIGAFRQAVRLAPNDGNTHKELAAAYAAEARYEEAFGELMAALLIDTRDAQAHAAIGGLLIDTGRDAEAVGALTRALALAPARHEPRYALARALTRLGRRDEAAQQLALFEQARRAALERRRRDIADDVEREEEAARARRPPEGGRR